MDAGRRIGKYVLDERIAVGGMAEVWAAHVEGLRGFVKPVALKFILESFAGDSELERLFVNEARIAARLQHANLVAVFDFDKVAPDQERGFAGRYYIAMERIDGYDLRRISDAARAAGYVFPVPTVLFLAGEICKALRYVHEKREEGRPLGLVHRDVSPHNVLVGATGEVKLSDFGIAKAREHSARNTKPGSLRGKIAYASPEQLGGQLVDHRADQFAAGVTLWELLAGRRLFDGASDVEILGRVARCEIPTLAEAGARRDVSPTVEAALRRMLALDPGARFATTADALTAVLALPGYTPDGAPLGELVRTLFRAAAPDISHTLPIQASPAPARRSEAPTRTMHEAPLPPVAGGSVSETADVRSGPRAAKVTVAALAAGLAVVAAWSLRDRSGAQPVAAPPVAGEAPPRPAPRPTPSASVEVAAPAQPSSPAAVEVVAPAPALPAAMPPARDGRGHEPRHAARPGQRAARAARGDAAVARVTPLAVPAAPAPAVASPAVVPRPSETGVRRSANGAPIIE